MTHSPVFLVDTSIILRLIGVDGDEHAKDAADELDRRKKKGERFILSATALIESGNRVAQQPKDRRRFAEQLKKLIEAANEADPPWILHEATLDKQFVDELLAGDSTGSDLVTLLGNKQLGTGDVAILVERDRLREKTAFENVSVWTLDKELAALS